MGLANRRLQSCMGLCDAAWGWRRRGGQSKSARPGTKARHIGTNEATADAMSTRGRRGGVRVTHWQNAANAAPSQRPAGQGGRREAGNPAGGIHRIT